jgi:hypothetical protein
MNGEATLDVWGTFSGEAIRVLILFAAQQRERLALGEPEVADWRDAVGRILIGFDPATGLYEQFAGYYKLEPLDLSLDANRKMPIDVVIGRERTQRSQVGQTGRCGGAARPPAGRVPRRGGESQFPLLRATLCPWQFVERAYPRAGRGTAR